MAEQRRQQRRRKKIRRRPTAARLNATTDEDRANTQNSVQNVTRDTRRQRTQFVLDGTRRSTTATSNYLGTSILTYIDDIVVVDWIRTTGRAAYGRVVMTVDMIRTTGRTASGGIGNIDISDTYYSADDEHYLD